MRTLSPPVLPASDPGLGGSLRLRPVGAGDVAGLVDQFADPASARWTRAPQPYRAEDARRFVDGQVPDGWRSGRSLVLAVELDGRFAGTVELRPDGAGAAEVGYAVAAWARGRGAAAGAVRAFLTWAWPALDLQVVHWRAEVGNWASRRVAWACGFRVEGQVRGLLVTRDGQRADGWVGSLRRGEPMRPAVVWLDVPVIELGAVRLRPWREQDAPRVVEACVDPATQRWLPRLPAPYTLADAQEYVAAQLERAADGQGIDWCVADGADDQVLAAVSLTAPVPGRSPAEIGYWAHPAGRGRGVVTRAVRAAARHALIDPADGGLGAPRVVIRVAEGNDASARVAERAGFRHACRVRQGEQWRDGNWADLLEFELLAGELLASEAVG